MLIARSALVEVARNFVAALVGSTAAVFFMLAVIFMKKTPGVGLGFLVEVFPLFFPLALQFTVPISMLGATVMAFSRMASSRELTALSASGVRLGTIVAPVLAFAAIVALGAFLLTEVTAPLAASRLRSAKRDLITQLQTSFRSGLRDLDLGRGRISFESFAGREFSDVCVEWRQDDGTYELWRAQSGSISVTKDDRVVLALQNAQQTLPRQTKHGEATLSVGDIVLEHSLADFVDAGGRARNRADLVAEELAYAIAREGPGAERQRISPSKAFEELARRSALAASAFFFALIAIPAGILTSRRGRVGAILYGVGPIMVGYFPAVIAGSNLARGGTLPAYPALWAPNALLAVVAVVLLVRRVRV
ncbi:MAG: LptF/LptG family permease [Planctomycetota bacterium]|nr:LptF/LptG family permease [Planctomycetota bacterium]